MDQTLPIIYSGGGGAGASGRRLSFWLRLLAFGVSICCLAVLVLAARLQPSPTGIGSHQSIGLQPCQFLVSTGLPCPSCGMTTSFTWLVRGNVLASVYVQPMGAVLAAATAFCLWGGLYVAATGRPVYRLLRLLPGRHYLFLLFLGVLAWGWKILLYLNGLDGWR